MASARYLGLRAYQRARSLRARLVRGTRWSGIRILGYHRLADEPEPLSVPPDRFRAQLEHVLAAGLSPVSLERALELLAAGEVEGRYVVVTFDDGYLDNLEQGEPVLAELGIPATIFLPTAIVDGEAQYFWYRDKPPSVTWDDARAALARGVVEFASHTRTHRWLPDLSDDDAREEIAGSREDLERRLGIRASAICYPGGLYTGRDERLTREAGYRVGVSTAPGVNRTATTVLRRTLVFREDGRFEFTAKIAGAFDRQPLARRLAYRRLGGFAREPR